MTLEAFFFFFFQEVVGSSTYEYSDKGPILVWELRYLNLALLATSALLERAECPNGYIVCCIIDSWTRL